jgi:hypothetical protein
MGIAVSSEYKQQGIGCALLQKVELWTLETGGLFARPWLFRKKANPSSPTKNRQSSTEGWRFLLLHYYLFTLH